ncbi:MULTISPECIES: hypothetical protein [Priestia]|uniref:hypothetical protein n=1 Tax=Priestia TaxID=2800373 RepID=UPI00064F39AB|nr:hypothetical protein [Priestia aryabhattai]KML23305.1 hypothetical protein VL11_27050 [Priestia aryabhattai]KMN98936.1 hypothetical protein ABV89_14705 [Priestia aryabhattai]
MLKKSLLTGAIALSVIVPTAASAAYTGYVGYTLPAYSGNNYTSAHTKQTGDDFIKNKLENLSKTSKANFWAANTDKNAISGKYDQKVGSIVQINFSSGKSKGYQARLGMENDDWSKDNAFAAGQVDFR